MQVFKFFLLMVIWALSTLIGILVSRRFSNRVQELKEIKNALNIIEMKIKFTYEPIPEIFNQISKTMPERISNIFKLAVSKMKEESIEESWNYAIENSILDISIEDKKMIKDLGKMLRKN